jgi:hypothetical protein
MLFATQNIFSTILKFATLQIGNSPFRLKHPICGRFASLRMATEKIFIRAQSFFFNFLSKLIIPDRPRFSNGSQKRSCFISRKRAKLNLFSANGHESRTRLRAETHAHMYVFSKGVHSGVQARITEWRWD